MIENFINKSIKIITIKDVIKLCENLIDNNYNPILILDIDDTVFSSRFGEIFLENEICELVEKIYTINQNNLLFLTARHKSTLNFTLAMLNLAKLIKKEENIYYNILFSPLDRNGSITKGKTLYDYLFDEKNKHIINNKANWIIFVDDILDNIVSVNNNLEHLYINYTLFHYVNKKIIKN